MLQRLIVTALALIATAEAPSPATLTPYIKDGKFDPGDYGWMRGAFADATPAQKAEWRTLMAWRRDCRAGQVAVVRAELAHRGITPAVGIEQSVGTGICASFAYARPQADEGESWPAFQATLARAQPIALAIVWSAALAQQVAEPDTQSLAGELIARPMTDQVLRGAASWNEGEVKGAPPLEPAALGIVRGRIWLAISERDHANTEWLKGVVTAQGWPTIAKVGRDAAHMAWLLAQHADDDPVFQLDALRLMEPLAVQGEVAKKDYAYLYDRVMLKLVGKQRYASQYTCAGGRHTPLPLEDAAKVDAMRRRMEMDTVAENVARMDKTYGPCPPDVIPPSPATR